MFHYMIIKELQESIISIKMVIKSQKTLKEHLIVKVSYEKQKLR